ncbi:MAG: biopolymer transporter ExbD [Polyangia bacterium]
MASALERPGMIKPPSPRLRKFIPLKFVTKHGAGKKSTYAELNLTSMVDMLTILVVFLLQTFSASGELLTVSKNITLPEAVNWKDLEQAPIIAISKDSVTLNGDPKGNSAELSAEQALDQKIPQLHDDLVVLKNNFKLLHPNPEDWKGLVIVQADKQIDFKILKRVMYTCAAAGYANVNFAVQQRGKGGGGG